jgi:probable HAF family extracellular repeat protein
MVNGKRRAFRTDATGAVVTDLGSLVADGSSTATAINANGVVVGSSQAANGFMHAVKYPLSGAPQDLGILPSGRSSVAFGINAAETVVGHADQVVTENSTITRAFRRTAASTALEVLPTGENPYAGVRDINDDGIFVGERGPEPWLGKAFRLRNGNIEDIPTLLAGDFSAAYAVNKTGVATGWSTTANNDVRHAFVSVPFKRLVDIGTLPGGFNSIGYDINDGSVVVGGSDYSPEAGEGLTGPHAIVWTFEDGLRDLNRLIPANSGWILSNATGINNKGQIVGYGIVNDQACVYRLDPVGLGTPGRVQLSKTQVRFGTIRVGQRSRRNLTLVNAGEETFSGRVLQPGTPFHVISVGGSTATDESGDFPLTLTRNQQVEVVLEFRPRRGRTFQERLRITNNNPSLPTLAVRLKGIARGR